MVLIGWMRLVPQHKVWLPDIEEKVGAFSREVYRQLEKRRNGIVCTEQQINERYQKHCGVCSNFDGIICKEYGCSTNAQALSRYYSHLLNPKAECTIVPNGYKPIS